jgi:hypothetical protein
MSSQIFVIVNTIGFYSINQNWKTQAKIIIITTFAKHPGK